MSEFVCKAIIFKDLEEVYGPCGCGLDMAILPILMPRNWVIEDMPTKVEEHAFGTGLDFRRASGLSCNLVFEHKVDGMEVLANFSCCRDCAERAVESGYAVWADGHYPMTLR